MYKKGEVKSVTFAWDRMKKDWRTIEPFEPEEKKFKDMGLNKVLLEVQFVSAAVYSCGDTEKLVLFYTEPVKGHPGKVFEVG